MLGQATLAEVHKLHIATVKQLSVNVKYCDKLGTFSLKNSFALCVFDLSNTCRKQ